jgi:transcriptional regulator with XRE-family HTH domain
MEEKRNGYTKILNEEERKIKETIAKNLQALRDDKKARDKKDFTQKMLAKVLNVDNTTISNHETGLNTPDALTLINYANFYGVSLDYICGIDVNITNANNVYKILTDYLKPKNEHDIYFERYKVLTLSINEALVDNFKTLTREYLHKISSNMNETAFHETLEKAKEKLFEIINTEKSDGNSADYVLIPIDDIKDYISAMYD